MMLKVQTSMNQLAEDAKNKGGEEYSSVGTAMDRSSVGDQRIERSSRSGGRTCFLDRSDRSLSSSIKSTSVPITKNTLKGTSAGLFDRKEIVAGNLIGAGTYCQVHVVRAIQLQKTNDNDTTAMIVEVENVCSQWTRECIAKHTYRSNSEPRYCIKFLKGAYWSAPDFETAASSLDNEIQILKSLRHDNIVQIRGVAKQGSEAYYVSGRHDAYFYMMDCMAESLEERMRRWRTQPVKRRISNLWRKYRNSATRALNLVRDPGLQDRIQVAFDMATAVEHIHSQRIVLRDVQPANFGFTKEYYGDEGSSVQLFDVTMAQRLGEGENEIVNDFAWRNNKNNINLVALNMRYAAPELRWADTYDTKADVFSFLSIVYELWTLKELDGNVKQRQAVLRNESRSFQNSIVGKLLSSGWSFRTSDRPSMTMVCAYLRTVLRQIQDGTFYDEGTEYTESSSSMSLRKF